MQYIDYTGHTIDNRYRIQKLLGVGGMGSVYLGKHVVIGKLCAVKFLHAEFANNEEVVKRFYREAQAAAAIRHKNIIDVIDVGVSTENEPYMVMEYLEGESLASMLDRTGPISLSAACAVLEPVLSALVAAHEKGIVHRDLKPENIFLSYDSDDSLLVKLIDFGISKFMTPTISRVTRTGMILGTPSYSSPEQLMGSGAVDERTDIYAVGVILYEMLTSKLPYEGEHYNALIYHILSDDPIPPIKANGAFPTEVESLLMRILSKDPNRRPSSAAALLDELKTLSAFQHRHQNLSSYSSGVTSKTVAGGDLGASVDESLEMSPTEILSALTEKGTPSEWAHSIAPKRRRNLRMMIGAALASVMVAAIIGGLLNDSDDDANVSRSHDVKAQLLPVTPAPKTLPSPVAAQTPVEEIRNIRIEIQGAPANASIFYDGGVMPTNRFQVTKSDAVRKLKVTAAGYEDFVLWVIPNIDQKINASLKPLEKPMVEGKKASAVETGSPKSGKTKPPKSKIIKSGKTKLTESFGN